MVESASVVGFAWDAFNSGWTRPGLPMLHHLAGPYPHFKAAIWDAWRPKVCFDLCRRQGFLEGPMLDNAGSLQLLHASHVKERDKALLRSIIVGGVWNGFLLGHARREIVPYCFCGGFDRDGHLFLGNVLTSPLVQIRENPEFHDLMQRKERTWPGCLLVHGWLPALDSAGGWATGPGQVSASVLETSLGRYSSHFLDDWTGSQEFATRTRGAWAASQEFEAGVGSGALSAVVWSGMRSLVSGVVGLGFLPCLHRS